MLLAGCGGGGGSDGLGGSPAPTPSGPTPTPPPLAASFKQIDDPRPAVVNDWQTALIESERGRGWGTVQTLPVEGQVVTQNPPVFSWPLHPPKAPNQVYDYDLEVRFPDGNVRRYPVATNWFLPREQFGAGSYTWRVIGRGLEAGGADAIGAWRQFSISADAQALFDPGALVTAASDASWFAAIAATPHPRVLTDARLDTLRPFLFNQRKTVWDAIAARVATQAVDPAQAPPALPATAQLTSVSETEQRRIEEAALVWRVWRSSANATEQSAAAVALADAKARLLNLANWDNNTFTGQDSATDVAVRHVLWALTLGYDHLSTNLSSGERDTVVQAIATRAGQVQSRAIGAFRARERMPFEAHSAASLITLAGATAVMAGDSVGGNTQFSQAQFARLVPLAYAFGHPWGGADGGYGNGGGYGEWLMDNSFGYLDALHAVTGANPYRLQQMQNYAKYRLYAIPYGRLHAPFGDGAVIEGFQVPYYAYWLATRIPGQATAWMAAQQPIRANFGGLTRTLMSPAIDPATAADPGMNSSSMLFASTGQVSMHSSLTDTARTTIHFKSSPFGSSNHSHADQNHLVIGSKGKALLIDSGYYDSYLSPHAKAWYRQTKAHNAVTYDGGTGQRTEANGQSTDISAMGQIVGYHDGGNFTIATGDATPAYDPAVITRARRTVLYLKPDLLLVHDDLAASRAVRWEWNFHSLYAPNTAGGASSTVKITNGDASLCMQQIGVERFDRLTVIDQFPVDPALASFAPQFHGTWQTSSARNALQSLVLIDVGCKGTTTPTVAQTSAGLLLELQGRQFLFRPGLLPAYSTN
ncbi:heparinase II/III domain-containing protein [Chitinolyticbacter meiyuanensis]|uniref:heparinase II/III domain-containing protein n=1 Tax=Chitinolyticbacter meiyuanensis TaxID=682798 RepID=UPI001652B563|nr:heparinase II/III family protein [Chitinolyticbacter meiyuanensis]